MAERLPVRLRAADVPLGGPISDIEAMLCARADVPVRGEVQPRPVPLPERVWCFLGARTVLFWVQWPFVAMWTNESHHQYLWASAHGSPQWDPRWAWPAGVLGGLLCLVFVWVIIALIYIVPMGLYLGMLVVESAYRRVRRTMRGGGRGVQRVLQ